MEALLRAIVARLVTHGSLTIITASGTRLHFGDGTGEPVVMRFTDRAAQWSFLLDPDLKLGELIMDGRLVVEEGSVYGFLDLLFREMRGKKEPLVVRILDRIRFGLRRFAQRNGLKRARSNVAHHYDLDDRLYALFLDEDWQYSCAYFETPEATLDEAQLAKKRHIAAKLSVQPGDKVLDIGSGWGGMALYLANIAKAGSVLGVTLSKEQLAVAEQRAAQAGLDERITFALRDYREVQGQFDRIVSVGMFEHVGIGFHKAFFEKSRALLAENGTMLLHTIGLSDGPAFTNPWIDKYIFPGGHLPALSEVTAAIERSGLIITDIEILRLHYASTLRAWRERFLARRDEALALYDERFCRMWEFYLASSEAAFRHQDVVVFQIQLAKQLEAVPLTRNYIGANEAALRQAEKATKPPIARMVHSARS